MLLRAFLTVLLLTILMCCGACKSSDSNSKHGSGTLRDYVREPLDKAEEAELKVDQHNEELQKQYDQVFDD